MDGYEVREMHDAESIRNVLTYTCFTRRFELRDKGGATVAIIFDPKLAAQFGCRSAQEVDAKPKKLRRRKAS